MIQIWNLDKNNFYRGISEFVNEEDFNEVTMTKTPLLIGYIKARFDGKEWVEGATVEKIQEWKDSQVVNVEPSFEESQIEYNVDLDYRLSIIEMGL